MTTQDATSLNILSILGRSRCRAERVPISLVTVWDPDPYRISMPAVPNLERYREEGAAIRGNYSWCRIWNDAANKVLTTGKYLAFVHLLYDDAAQCS